MSKKQSPKRRRKTAAKNPDIFFWINSEDEVVAFDDAVDSDERVLDGNSIDHLGCPDELVQAIREVLQRVRPFVEATMKEELA